MFDDDAVPPSPPAPAPALAPALPAVDPDPDVAEKYTDSRCAISPTSLTTTLPESVVPVPVLEPEPEPEPVPTPDAGV